VIRVEDRACRRIIADPALSLTSSASIPRSYPTRSHACWSAWPRCPTHETHAAYGTLWLPCSRTVAVPAAGQGEQPLVRPASRTGVRRVLVRVLGIPVPVPAGCSRAGRSGQQRGVPTPHTVQPLLAGVWTRRSVITRAPSKAAVVFSGRLSIACVVKSALRPAAFSRNHTVRGPSCTPSRDPRVPVCSVSGTQIPSGLLMWRKLPTRQMVPSAGKSISVSQRKPYPSDTYPTPDGPSSNRP
jgi:hypothetical protein